MTKGINIRYTRAWGKSYNLMIPLLKKADYYSNNPKLLLNFGSNYNNDYVDVLNKRIEHIVDKVKMNKLFDKYNIPHPKTYYYPFNNLPKRGMCVIKLRNGSGRGKGIKFIKFRKLKNKELNNTIYIQHYIPFEEEYRVVNFIGNYRCREKIGNDKVKNSFSCRYRNFRDEELEKYGKYVCEKFKVDFAGLDIGIYNKHFYMIEINSACGVNENSANTLLHFLIKYYEMKYNG